MGCTSSTEYHTDPATGKDKKKNRMGGAYPGQRRPNQKPYLPQSSQFDGNGQAVAHFIAYGGGNALTLVQANGSSAPQTGGASAVSSSPQAEYISVTLPDGVAPGQIIHVQAPDGRLNAIVIPEGFGPGSTFTVEFAPAEASTPGEDKYGYPDRATPSTAAGGATTTMPPHQDNTHDDGFATGFGNPNYRPPTAQATMAEPDIGMSSYPTTSANAMPVYNNGKY